MVHFEMFGSGCFGVEQSGQESLTGDVSLPNLAGFCEGGRSRPFASTEGSGAASKPESGRCGRTRTATMGRQRADFSELACKWVDDPAFDEIIAARPTD
jgi:hypothetical protein